MRLVLLLSASLAIAGESAVTVANPTAIAWDRVVIRLPGPAVTGQGVSRGGTALPSVVLREDGKDRCFVLDSLAAGATVSYAIGAGAPGKPSSAPVVRVSTSDGVVELDNGQVAVRLPVGGPAGSAPGPIAGYKLGTTWVGGSAWVGTPACTGFTSEVIANGTVCAAVRMTWRFAGTAGITGDVPCFAEVVVRLDPDAPFAEIQERHTLPAGARWELRLATGWKPTQGFSIPYSGGAGSGEISRPPPRDRPLLPVDNPSMRPDLYLAILPRWNQHYKDGWYAAVSDGTSRLGAVAVAASRWVWPHDNAIELSVDGGGTLRLPSQRGRRVWWLTAQTATPDLVRRWCWEHPRRLADLDTQWDGQAALKGWPGTNFYDGGQMNPTGGIRGLGRNALKDAGKPGGLEQWLRALDRLHPDAYGSYWLGWSPENPNFFSDFSKPMVGWAARCQTHPRFAAMRDQIEARLREDLFHSVTMPGGAGQECPGYLRHALSQITDMAPVCQAQFGFDPRTWDRYAAGQEFLRRVSQPDGAIRRDLPIGDTHPDKKAGGPYEVQADAATVRGWTSEELPGFGAVLRHQPGTPDETYVAFKSGPNRGHYHGDQLSIHWCAKATGLLVDHHCSYHPRAGQEHMHNRMAFSTPELPYANMDGYERLIAFQPSAVADIAIGQVSSPRLRATTKLPPETWHQDYPQVDLGGELTYRRTIVLVKSGPIPFIVLRDEVTTPKPVTATVCFHARVDAMPLLAQGIGADAGDRLAIRCFSALAMTQEGFPWQHDNGSLEKTEGLRAAIAVKDRGVVYSVLYPGAAPAITCDPATGSLRIGAVAVTFAASSVSVEAGAATATLPATAINLDRPQGDIGLFVPDAGYPFGPIPDWLIRQRWTLPAFAPVWAARLRDERL